MQAYVRTEAEYVFDQRRPTESSSAAARNSAGDGRNGEDYAIHLLTRVTRRLDNNAARPDASDRSPGVCPRPVLDGHEVRSATPHRSRAPALTISTTT